MRRHTCLTAAVRRSRGAYHRSDVRQAKWAEGRTALHCLCIAAVAPCSPSPPRRRPCSPPAGTSRIQAPRPWSAEPDIEVAALQPEVKDVRAAQASQQFAKLTQNTGS
ncbi:hypothetical protein GCM10010251_36910 [Streptomyces aurantiogriseus]|uniref:Uncharacterized protein n=1 Tax=Streptomyces aurantiogriseus TaxID=66870 RepID=A0A918CCN5_9ACTN|nr:hypothetical protein GCM10010251_36910 [Streptomyces aurantiogriseus]